MSNAFEDLITNLRGGIELCRLKKQGPENFRSSPEQMVLLVFSSIVVSIVSGYLTNLPDPTFNIYAFTAEGFSIALLLLSAHIVARYILHRPITIALSILLLSTGLIFTFVWRGIEFSIVDHIDTLTYWWVWGGIMLWLLVVIFWCILTINGAFSFRVPLSFFALLFTWIVPVWYLAAGTSYWYPHQSETRNDAYTAYRNLDAERMLFSQPELLKRDLAKLQPEREGIVDVYFVGIGGYARQDVFLKETVFAKNLFDQRFGTQGRSINLINHLSTYKDSPLATSTNLEETLRYIGSVMNKDEDMLVLYMTSHGSSDHEFTMSFWPLPLNDITPAMLRTYLDDSGIKWRVVVISSCYSGGFVEPLKNDYTAIATAAASDRTSFGCNNENDFTYFGEELLKHELQNEYSLPIAFSQTIVEIAERETREHLTSSKPQVFIGASVESLLDKLSSELQAHEQASLNCGDDAGMGQVHRVAEDHDTVAADKYNARCHSQK